MEEGRPAAVTRVLARVRVPGAGLTRLPDCLGLPRWPPRGAAVTFVANFIIKSSLPFWYPPGVEPFCERGRVGIQEVERPTGA